MSISWIQLASSFWMMTIICFVQMVHYPLFLSVPKSHRIEYAQNHQRWISYLVVPGMLIELFSLLIWGVQLGTSWHWWIASLLLGVIWISTVCLQVPCHQRLLIVPDNEVVNRLIKTNWVRTIAWIVKTMLIAYVIWKGLI